MSVQQKLDVAVQLHNTGRLTEAEVIYKQILEVTPENHVATNLLGVIAHQGGNYDIAVQLMQKAISLKLDYVQAHNNLGCVYLDLKRLYDAEQCFRKALKFRPDYESANFNLGKVLTELGHLVEAVQNFRHALKQNNDNAKTHFFLATVLQKQGELSNAVASFREALVLKPDYVEAHVSLGNVLKELELLDDAVVSYRKALSIQPSNTDIHCILSSALSEQGKLDDAVECLKQAISIQPDNPLLHFIIGIALQDQGNLDKAIANYQKAISIKPDYVEVFPIMCLALRSMCHEISTNSLDISYIEGIIDTLPTSPEADIIRLQIKSILGQDTLQTWERTIRNLPTLQSETIDNVNKKTFRKHSPVDMEGNGSDKKILALVQFGRSGTGYLHSLLDGHPNISTLPGVYMYGFFGKGVWNTITSEGFQGIPEQFSLLYEPLFNAKCLNDVPGRKGGQGFVEGFVEMGPNRDTPLTLDRDQFVNNLSDIINDFDTLNHGELFESIHSAYEKLLGNNLNDKSLIFYHLHNYNTYCRANFLKYFPKTHFLTIIRNPLQSMESLALFNKNYGSKNEYLCYRTVIYSIASMLENMSNAAFKKQGCSAIRLEDLKEKPKETLMNLCVFLGIDEAPSLYECTMQGLKWWGDPTSSMFGKTQTQYSDNDDPTQRKIGSFFNSTDQFILGTLLYPLSVRFCYVEKNNSQFKKDLQQIRPLLDTPLNFEITMAEKFAPSVLALEKTMAFKTFHAMLVGRWSILDEYGTYPNMPLPLPN